MKNRCVLFQTIRRGLSEGQLETKLAEAEIRRKELQEEKVKQVMEHSGLERHGRMRSASAYKYVPNYSYVSMPPKPSSLPILSLHPFALLRGIHYKITLFLKKVGKYFSH